MKLTAIKVLKGKIRLKSGLHIGAGNTEMHIGGMDNPVVKHPHTDEPYIPGSSIKGKVRSLLELRSGLAPFTEGQVVTPPVLMKREVADSEKLQKEARAILKIFGSTGAKDDTSGEIGPTRVSFSDCYLDEAWKTKARAARFVYTEEKSENSINRLTGTAQNPRLTERVPEGAEFSFQVTYKVLQEGDEALFNEYLLRGLKLLELDALGGSGSRGYGRIRFMDLDLDGAAIQERFDTLQPF